MEDALLISEQYLEGVPNLGAGSSESAPERASVSKIDAYRRQSEFSPPEQSSRRKRVASGQRLVNIAEIMKQLAARQRQQKHEAQFQEEMKWIAENRTQFAGQWVALLGSTCLATGASAREVFEASKGSALTPLITYIDPEPLPFMGW